jgi:hypothetical protein
MDLNGEELSSKENLKTRFSTIYFCGKILSAVISLLTQGPFSR